MIKPKNVFIPRLRKCRTDLPVYWGILKVAEESEENLVLRRAEPNDKDIFDAGETAREGE